MRPWLVAAACVLTGCAVTADPQRVFDRAADAEARLGRSGEKALDSVAELASRAKIIPAAVRSAIDGLTELEAVTKAGAAKEAEGLARWGSVFGAVLVLVLVGYGCVEAARIRWLLRKVHEDVKRGAE